MPISLKTLSCRFAFVTFCGLCLPVKGSQDSYHHLITTSSDLNQPIWNQCDYYTHHDYPADLISTLSDPAGVPGGQPLKPVFGAECGLDNTPHLGVNAPIWAGLMGAQSGNAQPSYWDRIDADNDYASFHAASDFTLYSGLAEHDSLNRSSPHVTSSQNSALVFSPGGGWGDALQDTFTVQDAAPSGIGRCRVICKATTNEHLTITFRRPHPAPSDISYLFEVTDNLMTGPWHSGPGFTSQALTDNQDGTETVTITDNTLVAGSSAHFLRIRISQP